jgi:3-methyl-2-oxobutanoate hydroxymethyltransferase
LSKESPESQAITTQTFQLKKQAGDKITMLTAYDYLTSRAVDRAGIDSILVGDSLGMVMLGYENTLPVTMEDMLHHCRAVSRGASRALLIGDMPFMSYQVSTVDAVKNAGRFLQEGGMNAVKLEGGRQQLDAIKSIIGSGIPVLGHLGLTPQSIHKFGGFKTQGRTSEEAKILLEDALLLEDTGCFGLILESIPDRIAEYITKRLNIPTIGIGAGPGCDGQVLVTHDMLGLFDKFTPKFVKRYGVLHESISQAIDSYREDVLGKDFPLEEHSFTIKEEEWEKFLQIAGNSNP